jgi:AraC family transcriptional regulator of adaptative response / DNA-3-methyladenine glycosylase II
LANADLSRVGLTKARAATVRALSKAVHEGRIRFEGIVAPDDFLSRLCEIPGIGRWTAQYISMRALGEPDAFPSGDLGLLRALALESYPELERRSEAWRPWRAYATMYLWSVPGVPATRPPLSKSERVRVARTPARDQESLSA